MARPRPARPRRSIAPETPPHEVAQLRAEFEARLDHIRSIIHRKRRAVGHEVPED